MVVFEALPHAFWNDAELPESKEAVWDYGWIFRAGAGTVNLADEVAHLFVLGLQVALVGGLAGNFGGDALDDLDAGEFEGLDFVRIVGDEADGFDAELFEDSAGSSYSRQSAA